MIQAIFLLFVFNISENDIKNLNSSFLLERMTRRKFEKVMCFLNDKKEFVVHIRNLKEVVNQKGCIE